MARESKWIGGLGSGSGGGGSFFWGDAVATVGSLPAGVVTGEIRQALDTNILYVWNGSAWVQYFDPNAVAQLPIDLASEVTGVLPIANGGTGSATGFTDQQAEIDAAQLDILDLQADKLDLAGGTMTGPLILAADPLAALEPATKQYTDAADLLKLDLAGGTMSGYILLHADPALAMHPTTKQYVDNVLAGLSPKGSVKAATTAVGGNVILSGLQTIDGVSLLAGERVLIKNQTLPAENGIYIVNVAVWTRSLDMDNWLEVPGAYCFVEGGTVNIGAGFFCTSPAGGTINVSPIVFSQFAGAGTYTADGNGLELIGTQFSLELDGVTLSKSSSGLKVADGQIDTLQLKDNGITGPKLQADGMSSADLRGALDDETGIGLAVFNTSPAIITPNIDGGTASAASQITLPKATVAILAGLVRKEGNAFFCTDIGRQVVDNGSKLLVVGPGADVVSLIDDHSNSQGWARTGAVFPTNPTTTVSPSDLPLQGATPSAIQISATGSGAELSNHTNYPVTTSAAMSGRIQIDFYMRPGTGFAANEWTVSVYQGATRQVIDQETAGVYFLPNAAGRVTVTFNGIASTSYTLRFARIAGAGSAVLNISNVFFGLPFTVDFVEYASNASVTDGSDDGTTGNFRYGAAGSSFPGNLTTARNKRVRFHYAAQDGDIFSIEVLDAASRWVPVEQAADDFAAYSIMSGITYTTGTAGGNTVGIAIKGVVGQPTDIDVMFGRYLHADLDGGNLTQWGSIAAARKWRVKKKS